MSPFTPLQIHRSPAGAATCADTSSGDRAAEHRFPPTFPAIFPPQGADAQTRRAWLATTPWPEVLFSSAR